jgi:hypothetical protein
MDASLRLWFGDREGLHEAVGDATRMIIGAYFDHKKLKGYYNIFSQILRKHGDPYMFYTDRSIITKCVFLIVISLVSDV